MARLQAIRGMHDVLMQDAPRWQFLEETIKGILAQYGYREIRLPVVESTALFARSIGDHTDIVSGEMYTFVDRNDASLSLRPEGTAGCVRAGIEHGLFHNRTQRLWYMGPMFRHERPQQGRQRQFHQIGVEAFGLAGPDIDAELILLCARIWKTLKLQNLTLEINSLGTPASRKNYRAELVDYFSSHKEQLDRDSLNTLQRNPLRILDSKKPQLQALIQSAPVMDEYLDNGSADHFNQFKGLLDDAGIGYQINPRLVRGLDYYTKTVFEWTTERLGAQGTVCAGGRYDGLVERHGARPTPAIGFAIGMERLLELCKLNDIPDKLTPHVYLLLAGDDTIRPGLKLAEQLREQIPGSRILTHCGGGSIKSQFKKADKSGARLAMILGQDELRQQRVTIKSLRSDDEQQSVARSELAKTLRGLLSI